MTERKFTPFEDNGIQEYVTRDGREAKVCVITGGTFPNTASMLKGFAKFPDGVWAQAIWSDDGLGLNKHYDLFDVPVKHTRWVNVYSNTSGVHHTNGGLYLDKVEADGYAGKTCVACIEITFEEGEGL
jgi:hypothetical protein